MIPFLASAALLAAIALGLLLWPLRRGNAAAAATSRRQLNAAIYRDQMAELEADRADGDLGEADYGEARQELQRRILDDSAEAVAAAAAPPASGNRTLAVALSAAIPVVAAVLYLLLGNPAGLNPPPAEYVPTTAEIEAMVEQALKKDPDNRQALWFAGMIAFDRGDAGQAVAHWERLKKLLPPDSEDAKTVARGIEEARAKAKPLE